MLGLIRVRVEESAPRARTERIETLGGMPFQAVVLQVRSTDGMLDCLMMRQAIRLLAMRGVSRAAAPDIPYIKELLWRYHIEKLSHEPLLRACAPALTEHVLHGTRDGAALIYARRMDADVLSAARHAATRCRTVVLDCGRDSERLRRRLLDETGCAALLEQVGTPVGRTAVLLFDKPPAGFRVRMSRPVSLALRAEAAPAADFDDARVSCPIYEPLQDTDREAVLGVLVSRNQTLARELQIVNLVKKS